MNVDDIKMEPGMVKTIHIQTGPEVYIFDLDQILPNDENLLSDVLGLEEVQGSAQGRGLETAWWDGTDLPVDGADALTLKQRADFVRQVMGGNMETKERKRLLVAVSVKGSSKSGNHGHAGIPGKRGGSAPRSAGTGTASAAPTPPPPAPPVAPPPPVDVKVPDKPVPTTDQWQVSGVLSDHHKAYIEAKKAGDQTKADAIRAQATTFLEKSRGLRRKQISSKNYTTAELQSMAKQTSRIDLGKLSRSQCMDIIVDRDMLFPKWLYG